MCGRLLAGLQVSRTPRPLSPVCCKNFYNACRQIITTCYLSSLRCSLSPYSYDESCLSSSQDHIPLAALPLLATSAPQYQDAVATVILRANQVYSDFIKSLEGESFNGQVRVKTCGGCSRLNTAPPRGLFCVHGSACLQVCVIGDCVGGILGFDALCSSSITVSESQNSSRRGSTISVQVPFSSFVSYQSPKGGLVASCEALISREILQIKW